MDCYTKGEKQLDQVWTDFGLEGWPTKSCENTTLTEYQKVNEVVNESGIQMMRVLREKGLACRITKGKRKEGTRKRIPSKAGMENEIPRNEETKS
jgi:hypothetical protein